MQYKINRFVYWLPRVLSLLFILFLALMSLDIFSMQLTFWQMLLGLFIHNIPTLILLAVLIISWKYEIVGGIVFILAGLLYIGQMVANVMIYSFEWYMLAYSIEFAGIALLIGILFLAGWYKKKE